jgi:hypothetical protein
MGVYIPCSHMTKVYGDILADRQYLFVIIVVNVIPGK